MSYKKVFPYICAECGRGFHKERSLISHKNDTHKKKKVNEEYEREN